MSNRKSPQKLINPKVRQCPCGEYYSIGHYKKYCSPDCPKKLAAKLARLKNKRDFKKEHPELCSECGCTITKEYRRCLQCRIQRRIYQKAYNKRKRDEKRKRETASSDG